MVGDRRPEALVLFSCYCLLLRQVEIFWWMRGMSRSLMRAIDVAVAREWES